MTDHSVGSEDDLVPDRMTSRMAPTMVDTSGPAYLVPQPLVLL